MVKRPEPKNKLSPEEKQKILDVIKQDEYVDLPPSQIVPKLADKGIYIASESSFYRVMREGKLQHHHGGSKKPSPRVSERDWVRKLLHGYNYEHQYRKINFVTP